MARSATAKPDRRRRRLVEQVGDRRDVEEGRQHGELDDHGPGEQSVGRPADAPWRRHGAPAGEGVGSLAEHDGGERGARRGEQGRPAGEGVARAPPGGQEHGEERGHLDRRFHRAQHAERPGEEPPVEQVVADGRAVEDVSGRLLGAQREGGQDVGADVQREDLQHADRQREAPARQRPHDERGQLGDVVRQVVGEEPADVRERRAPLLDGGHDRGEVVVQQDEVGGLAGHVGSRATHRHPDRRLAAARGRR